MTRDTIERTKGKILIPLILLPILALAMYIVDMVIKLSHKTAARLRYSIAFPLINRGRGRRAIRKELELLAALPSPSILS